VLVAVGLRDRLPAQVRRLPAVGVIPQQLGQREGLLPQALDVAVPGISSRASDRNTAVQLGSSPTTLTPRRRYGARVSTVRCSTRRAVAS
jgi:hypothetical protein